MQQGISLGRVSLYQMDILPSFSFPLFVIIFFLPTPPTSFLPSFFTYLLSSSFTLYALAQVPLVILLNIKRIKTFINYTRVVETSNTVNTCTPLLSRRTRTWSPLETHFLPSPVRTNHCPYIMCIWFVILMACWDFYNPRFSQTLSHYVL